jgi:hypothetical protein
MSKVIDVENGVDLQKQRDSGIDFWKPGSGTGVPLRLPVCANGRDLAA